MSDKKHQHPIPSGGASQVVSGSRTPLRDNLESIVLAILMVMVVRQVVVEAFKIPTGSMAPTLLGVHKEVRCPNCGWTFRIGDDKVGPNTEVECPNCHYQWPGASVYYPGEYGGEPIDFRRPAWLWNEGTAAVSGQKVEGMQAANRINRWGSRIFVNKFIYSLRKPRRWEVSVFRYPFWKVSCNDCGWDGDVEPESIERCPVCGSKDIDITRKNYIKRVVGLPNETLTLRNGDVYVKQKGDGNFHIARKPPPVQRRLWLPVFDSSYVPEKRIEPRWNFQNGVREWDADPTTGALRCRAAGAEGQRMAEFARTIYDQYAYNGNEITEARAKGSNQYEVMGDVRLDLRFAVTTVNQNESGSVRMEIIEDDKRFALVMVLPGGNAQLYVDGTRVKERSVRNLPRGVKQTVSLGNYDDRLVVRWNGEILMKYEYMATSVPEQPRQSIRFGVENADVEFERIRIYRDVYYMGQTGEGGQPRRYVMGAGQYMVLGDNSPASSDSRAWLRPQVPEENFMGEAFAVFWPIHEISLLSLGSTPPKQKKE